LDEASIAFTGSLKILSEGKGSEFSMTHGLVFVTQEFQWTALF
jgi:hypothetical protein